MADTYCGKICENCTYAEALSCPGCKDGPGRPIHGECKLARCCRDHKLSECVFCNSLANCSTLRQKDQMAQYRLKRLEAEQLHSSVLSQQAPFLGKWLWLLFWLIIPSLISSIMTNENVFGSVPSVFIPGQILNALCSVATGVIFFKLSAQEARYRAAGICALIVGGVNILTAFTSGSGGLQNWTLLYTIPAAVVGFVGEYNEYMAHSSVLVGLDYVLSEKWCVLWKWYIGLFCGMIGSMFLIVLIPLLGMLVLGASTVGSVVAGIVKLVYRYQTAKIFREYSAEVTV